MAHIRSASILALSCSCLLAACTAVAPDNAMQPKDDAMMQDDASAGSSMMQDDASMSMGMMSDTAINEARDQWVARFNKIALMSNEAPCATVLPEGMSAQGVQTYTVGENHYVVQVLCDMFAYQNSYVFYNVHIGPNGEQSVTEMSFDNFDEAGKRTNGHVLIGATYDPATKHLSTLTKARGAGDCGGAATYRWREDIGGFFGMTQYRLKSECDGKADEWPVIFTSDSTQPAEGHMSDDMMMIDE